MIINIKFKSRYNDRFIGFPYSYRCDLPDVKVGDIVKAPTVNGTGVGLVLEVNVPETAVNPDVLPKLKTITEYAEERNCAQQISLEEVSDD